MTSPTTPILGLSLMTTSQAQKEVVFNELAIAFDALFKGSVLDTALTTPPSSPVAGDAYIVAPSANGAWHDKDGKVAFFYNGWQFANPSLKMRLYSVAQSEFFVYQSDNTWHAEPASTVSVLGDLTNVTGVPTDGQVLQFQTSDHKWHPWTIAFPPLALTALSDVQVTTGSGVNGYALKWNQGDANWELGPVLSAKPNMLSLPDVVVSGASDGKVLAYGTSIGPGGTPGVHFIDTTALTLVASLDQVGDVAYPTGGAAAIPTGASLAWTGAGWAPSSDVTATIGVVGIIDGPGAMDGHAHQIVRVNEVESNWEYIDFSLANMSDVDLTPGESAGIDGYVLAYSWGARKWLPIAHASNTLANLTDVAVTENAGIDGWFLSWKNSDTKWEARKLADVAISGAYADLSGRPTLFSGAYADLTGRPTISNVGMTGAYGDLINVPIFATVATSGAYSDLTGRPSIPVNGSFALSGLSDVTILSPTNGQALVWDATSSKWHPGTVSGGGGGGSLTVGGHAGITDIEFTGATVSASGTTATVVITGGGGGGGGGSGSAHRYWRMRLMSASTGHSAWGTSLCSMKDASGTTLTGSGTAIASYTDGSGGSTWSPSQAFDGVSGATHGWYTGNDSTSSSQDNNEWLGYDFGTPVEVASVLLAPIKTFSWTTPRQIAVDFSDNGTTWNEVCQFKLATGVDDTPQTCTLAFSSGGPRALADDDDVTLTSPSNGQVLTYDATTSKWINADPTGGTGGGGGTVGTGASSWVDLTFTNTVSSFGPGGVAATYYQSNETLTVAAGDILEVEGYVYHLASHNGEIVVSPDGSHGFSIAAQSDGNYVLYHYNTTGSANAAQGSASLNNYSGFYHMTLNVAASDPTTHANAFWGTINGWATNEVKTNDLSMAGTVHVYLNTTDPTLCRVRARVISSTQLPEVFNEVGFSNSGLALTRPTVVQSIAASGGIQNVTLGTAPTTGNLLVALVTHWSNSTAFVSGWNQALLTPGGTNDGIMIAWRLANSSDTTAINVINNTSGANIGLFEIADANLTQPIQSFNWYQDVTGTVETIDASSATKDTLTIGMFATTNGSTGPTSIAGGGASPTLDASTVGSSGSGSPRMAQLFHADTSDATDTLTATWASAANNYGIVVVLTPSATLASNNLAGLSDVAETSPTSKQQLLYDAGTSKWKNANSPYNLGAFLAGTMDDGETLMAHIAPYNVTFPSGLSGSYIKSGVAAAASTVVNIQKNGSTIGTITFASSASTGTIAITGDPSLVAGDVLSLVAPATADTALADVALTFAGYRI